MSTRVFLLGQPCPFANRVAERLFVAADLDIVGIGVPAPRWPSVVDAVRQLPPAPPGLRIARPGPPSILDLAEWSRRPVFSLPRRVTSATLAPIKALAPDIVVVVCYPWRLRAAWLRLPRLGCLNLHPSRLPDNRGPEPLFWTFYRGDRATGVTVHLVTADLDAGPIVRQQGIVVPDAIGGRALEHQLATIGGDLLGEACADLASGAVAAPPQDESRASYFSFPKPADLALNSAHSAQWVHNFVCGVTDLGHTPWIQLDHQRYDVSASLGVDPDRRATPTSAPSEEIWFPCVDGVVRLRARPA